MKTPVGWSVTDELGTRGRGDRRWTAGARPSAVHNARGEVSQRRILLAEDDDELRKLVAASLRAEGFEVVEARNGSELLEHLGSMLFGSGPPRLDLIVTDVRMPGFSGLDILAGLRREDWTTPVILITAFGDPELHAEARRLGALAVFDKPFHVAELREFIRGVVPALA